MPLQYGLRPQDDVTHNNVNSLFTYFLIHLFPSKNVTNLFTSKNKKAAFTLAEVLITLGIIGVVAAITMPTLIQNHQKQVYVNQLRKTCSTLSQGFTKYLADNENTDLTTTDLVSRYTNSGYYYYAVNSDKIDDVMNKYFKVVKSCVGSECDVSNYNLGAGPTIWGYSDEDARTYYLNDGTMVQIYGVLDERNIVININVDVNGNKKPNKYGRDVFKLALTKNGGIVGWGSTEHAYIDGEDAEPCDSYGGWSCAQKIMAEGWKMNY
jgi:prepilin-type N-terminal cleavage/methylation domain-containing protein